MTLAVAHHAIDVKISHDSVQMLLYQPFIEFEAPICEPFQIAPLTQSAHLANITRVIESAASTNPDFVVLPEYSVPGLNGIEKLHDAIAQETFPANTVLIAGIDGLSKSDYSNAVTLLGENTTVSPENHPDKVDHNQWVNCSITWVKNRTGDIHAWFQPKIEAAWPEENTHHLQMFRGQSVNLFKASFDNSVPCRFASLLCYDWIGRNGNAGRSVPEQLLGQLNLDWSSDQNKLHWLFLLQHNEKPNHYTFTTATRNFLTDRVTYPCVDCSQATVVCVSTAGSKNPCRLGTHGFTSIVFAPEAPFSKNAVCPPTITCKAKNLDAARDLGSCHDYVCREMGECIHKCNLRVPSFVRSDPTDRTLAVTGEVFSLLPGTTDPRLPNGPVSAAVKWVNDQLDYCGSPLLSERYFGNSSFKERIRAAEDDITNRYRILPGESAERVIQHSAPECPLNIDDWTGREEHSLAHIRDSLSLCSSGVALDTESATFHAYCDSKTVELLAIRGSSHEKCRNHFDKKCQQSHSSVLLITRDDDNSRVSEPEIMKFYEKERGTGVKVIDYQTLLQTCQDAIDESALVRELEEMVTIDEPTFI